MAGHAVLEFSLLAPWVFFLFVGALDFGFFCYGLIAVQNAARVAALNAGFSTTSAASQVEACYYVRRELVMMPNAQAFSLSCDQDPLIVTVTPSTDAEGSAASRVRVSYESVQMVPIPGLVAGKQRIIREVNVKVYGE